MLVIKMPLLIIVMEMRTDHHDYRNDGEDIWDEDDS